MIAKKFVALAAIVLITFFALTVLPVRGSPPDVNPPYRMSNIDSQTAHSDRNGDSDWPRWGQDAVEGTVFDMSTNQPVSGVGAAHYGLGPTATPVAAQAPALPESGATNNDWMVLVAAGMLLFVGGGFLFGDKSLDVMEVRGWNLED